MKPVNNDRCECEICRQYRSQDRIINVVVICIGFVAAAIMAYVGVICFRVWQ